MAGIRFTDLQARPTEFLDFTSLTLDEFQQLVPPFEAVMLQKLSEAEKVPPTDVYATSPNI